MRKDKKWEYGVCSNCGDEQPKLEPGTKVDEYTEFIQDDGQKAMIPEGFTVSGAETEDEIDEGLVIYLIDDKTKDGGIIMLYI